MLYTAPVAVPGAPHVIVIGNEKGGSGKTTIAMHLAVSLLKQGQRVGTIDLDSNQKALTRYIENRRIWANHRCIELEVPLHRCIERAESAKLDDNEAVELAAFEEAVCSIKESVHFLVIDTPSTDTYLMRLAHLVADTLVTPDTTPSWFARLAGDGASLTRAMPIGSLSSTAPRRAGWCSRVLPRRGPGWGSGTSKVVPSGAYTASSSPPGLPRLTRRTKRSSVRAQASHVLGHTDLPSKRSMISSRG
jgi:molybdopterin-guanine dinucleotide biosynthesis protein